MAALRETGLLDTPPELAFDDIVQVAAVLAATPIALISLVDEERQWFKARVGLDAEETPRDLAFCAHAILDPDSTLVVNDANADPRFAGNPLVVGGPRVVFYVGVPLRDPATQFPLGTLCVIDHHARSLDPAARRGLEALARQVESTLDLRRHAEELRLARAVAEQIAEDKSRFLAVMSHEIRTPVNGVSGLVELLKRGTLAPTERGYVDHLGQITRSLRALLDDILDFSKFSAGAAQLDNVPLEVETVARDAMSMVEPDATSKGLTLELLVNLPQGDVVRGDPTRLRQILVNLLSNAVKFTERGGVRLTCSGTSSHLSIEVEDTGIGIPEAAQRRLFEAFQQADRSTTRKYGGTGLGLAICAQLVRAMGGEITVSSAVGRGTRFETILPVEYCQPAPNSALMSDGEPPATLVRRTGARVLVADDDAINRLVIERMLSHLGARVELVVDGEAAVARLAAGDEFDLVLLDHEMPRLDGCGALAQIRARHGDAAPPCVVVTASALPGAKSDFLAAGFDGYVSKPVTAESLDRILSEFAA